MGRDDSLNQVWDAAEGCGHEWGSTVPRASKGAFAPPQGGEELPDVRNSGDSGAFCLHCPAWRGQLGLEPTPDLYVRHIVQVFREVRRVLRDDGTLWCNMGDCYNGSGTGQKNENSPKQLSNRGQKTAANDEPRNAPGLKPKDLLGMPWRVAFALQADGWYLRSDIVWAKPNPMPESVTDRPTKAHEYVFLMSKANGTNYWTHRDMPGMRTQPEPDYRWRKLAMLPIPGKEWYDFEADAWKPSKKKRLQETGEEIAAAPPRWHPKRKGCCADNPAGESEDAEPEDEEEGSKARGAHLWKRVNLWEGHDYFYDADAVREGISQSSIDRWNGDLRPHNPAHGSSEQSVRGEQSLGTPPSGRNLRSVWTIATQPYKDAHFATFPEALVEPCIKAGTSERGCCATCGAAWERVVESRRGFDWGICNGCGKPRNKHIIGPKTRKEHIQLGKSTSMLEDGAVPCGSSKTLGFRPTCSHPGEPVPCVVLDPFGGSGTVGSVARRLGRRAVLIEVKEEYAEMILERIKTDEERRVDEVRARVNVLEAFDAPD
jgi:DNA modification methylase